MPEVVAALAGTEAGPGELAVPNLPLRSHVPPAARSVLANAGRPHEDTLSPGPPGLCGTGRHVVQGMQTEIRTEQD